MVVWRRGERDAVPEPHVLGALAGRREEDFGRRGVRVLLKVVVFHLKDVVEAEFIGELDLVERLLVDAQLGLRIPVVGIVGLGELQLVEQTKLHGILPDLTGTFLQRERRRFGRSLLENIFHSHAHVGLDRRVGSGYRSARRGSPRTPSPLPPQEACRRRGSGGCSPDSAVAVPRPAHSAPRSASERDGFDRRW